MHKQLITLLMKLRNIHTLMVLLLPNGAYQDVFEDLPIGNIDFTTVY